MTNFQDVIFKIFFKITNPVAGNKHLDLLILLILCQNQISDDTKEKVTSKLLIYFNFKVFKNLEHYIIFVNIYT
jgi:hypothetical protein